MSSINTDESPWNLGVLRGKRTGHATPDSDALAWLDVVFGDGANLDAYTRDEFTKGMKDVAEDKA